MTEQPAEGGAQLAAPAAPAAWPQQQGSMHWQQPQQWGSPVPVAAAGSPGSRRRGLMIGAGVVALAAAFGAGLATGRATAKPAAAVAADPSSSAAILTIPVGGATSAASSAPVSGGSLISALLPVPSSATPRTASDASADGSMTLDQYLKLLYPTSTTERALLEARGFESAATRWFDTANGQEVSIYLVGFTANQGAQSYALALASAHVAANPGQTEFSVPSLGEGEGFETAKLDSYGNTDSFVYGEVGNVAVLVHCYTPAKLDRADLLALVSQQAARLNGFAGTS